MTIEIPLSQGKVALIDDEDLPLVVGKAWHVLSSHKPYAEHSGTDGGKRMKVYMHRLISGAKPGEFVDHINGDILDNRRANLRLCASQGNSRNRRKRETGVKSQYKGIYQYGSGGRWAAAIGVDYRNIHLGTFVTAIEAARAYDAAAKERFGEFARLNFSQVDP